MEHPERRSRVRLQFGFTGMLLVSLAVANFFAGLAYLLKARGGDPLNTAIFFGFTLMGPFLLAMLAGAFLKISAFFNR